MAASKSNFAKRHHIVPKCYLKLFLENESSRLYLVDGLTKRSFLSYPANVGYIDHFNTLVTEEGYFPFPLLKSLCQKVGLGAVAAA